jgi:hypothetical protein
MSQRITIRIGIAATAAVALLALSAPAAHAQGGFGGGGGWFPAPAGDDGLRSESGRHGAKATRTSARSAKPCGA